jgi:hypothetical protein
MPSQELAGGPSDGLACGLAEWPLGARFATSADAAYVHHELKVQWAA